MFQKEIILSIILLILFFYFLYKYLFFENLKTASENLKIPLFIRFLKLKLFKAGYLVSRLNDRNKIENLLQKIANPYNVSTEDILSVQQFCVFSTDLYTIMRIWFFGWTLTNILLYIFLFFLSLKIPILWLKAASSKRKREFDKHFNASIDFLILALESGNNIENAIYYLSKSSNNATCLEFKKLHLKIKYGFSLETVFENLKNKIQSSDFDKLCLLINQSKKLGVPLSKALKIQSELIRVKKRQKAETISREASVKIMFPLICCIFPALLIIYLGPGLILFLNLN